MRWKSVSAVLCIAVLCLASNGRAEALGDPTAAKLLRSAGALAYAEKSDYGAGIDHVYLGYDEAGDPVVGIAFRETKTYKKVTTVVSVTRGDADYKVAAAEVPDLEKVPGKAKSYVSDALQDITGRTFAGTVDARKLVDAVTGATKYQKAIYISYSLMATKLIEELEANPDWERKPVSPE